MYYETTRFPFTAALEHNWRVIRAELDALDRHDFIDWPEHSLYGDRGWETFGLYAFGQRQPEGCARCPQTERLVRQIPGQTAWLISGPLDRELSQLLPGAEIIEPPLLVPNLAYLTHVRLNTPQYADTLR